MNKVILFSLAILYSCSLLKAPERRVGPQAQNNPYAKKPIINPIKKKIALLPLYNESPVGGEDLSIQATEELRRELSRTRDFIVDPQAAAIFGTSKEIYAGGGVKLGKFSRKAKMAGVNLVVFGRIAQARVRQKADEVGLVKKVYSYANVIIELKIFDVISNKEVYSGTQSGKVDDNSFRFFLSEPNETISYRQGLLRYASRVAVRRFIPRIIKIGAKLDWVGRVAKIIGNKIYINAGRISGIHIGDILKVVTEGAEIFDPQTGALIGVSQGEVKGTLEVLDYFGPDGAVTILHSGGTVTEGDFVMLY